MRGGAQGSVVFLEETFQGRLEDDEVIPESLASLNLIERFLEKKLSSSPRPAEARS